MDIHKCVIVWVNELRLTDFVSEGGSAAIAQAQIKAADFANVQMSGNYSGINWGNWLGSFKWNRVISSKLFMTTSISYTRYRLRDKSNFEMYGVTNTSHLIDGFKSEHKATYEITSADEKILKAVNSL